MTNYLEKGREGLRGPKGATGAQGYPGLPGMPGEPGIRGKTGECYKFISSIISKTLEQVYPPKIIYGKLIQQV